MDAVSASHFGTRAGWSPAARRSASSVHVAAASPRHWMLVWDRLFLRTPTTVPHRRQATSASCREMSRSSTRGISDSRRRDDARQRLAGLLQRDELLLPGSDRLARIDLELEALHHLREDVVDVDVELLVPAAQLVDRTVRLAQQRVLDPRLVLPDLHVLEEAGADQSRHLSGDLAHRLVIEPRDPLHNHPVHQDELRRRDG